MIRVFFFNLCLPRCISDQIFLTSSGAMRLLFHPAGILSVAVSGQVTQKEVQRGRSTPTKVQQRSEGSGKWEGKIAASLWRSQCSCPVPAYTGVCDVHQAGPLWGEGRWAFTFPHLAWRCCGPLQRKASSRYLAFCKAALGESQAWFFKVKSTLELRERVMKQKKKFKGI